MENENLLRISTYAQQEGISVPAVHKRIRAGKIECVVIDDVKFIKTKK